MYLSLCIPTNGISEWVFPSLESIYNSGVDLSSFEVIVTDNGDNPEFKARMNEYAKGHSNLIYKETDAYMFDNQLEALKLAHGEYLKFVNHRSIFMPDRLQYMIDFIEYCKEDKPVIYFSNGAMGWGPNYKEFQLFDEFVFNLGIYGTWTSGVGIWRSTYEYIKDHTQYDKISPHAGILYGDRNNKKYIINDRYWMTDIAVDHKNKGKYNLYKAFGLDEFIITLNLYRDGDISEDTLLHVKKCFRDFLVQLYKDFNIKKIPCSYDLSGFDKHLRVFFDPDEIKKEAEAL